MKTIIARCLLISSLLFGQSPDNIKLLIHKISLQKTDTGAVNAFIELSKEYSSINNDSSLKYALLAKQRAQNARYAIGEVQSMYAVARSCYFAANYTRAKSELEKVVAMPASLKDYTLLQKQYNLLGATEFNLGNYKDAEKHYKTYLDINVKQKDTSNIISAYYNISLIYNSQGDYSKAIDYNFMALHLAEKINDTVNILIANNGLGIAYYNVGENDKATQYLKKAYSLALQKNMLFEQSGLLIDLGNAYKNAKKYETAIYYHDRAIVLARKIIDKRALSTALTNKAAILIEIKKANEAIILLNQSLVICKEINHLRGEMDNYNLLSLSYFELNDVAKSKRYAVILRDLSVKAGTIDLVKSSYFNLYRVFDAMKQTDSAYLFYKKYTVLKDSFINEDKYKEIANREFQYQKQKDDEVRHLEKQMAHKELTKQKQIRNIIFGASGILLILLLFVFKNYRDKQKANNEITLQNKVIEEKNKDITDSINYSKNIQNAILTPEAEIKQYLPDSFVLFKPKDIVSGDFYFIEAIKTNDQQNLMAVALADCTGHGVPGAFMSIIGYTILRQSLKESNVNSPAEALDYLNKELQVFLRQNQTQSNIKDGMDIVFCALNLQSRILSYAGANNPLWIVSKQDNLCDKNNRQLTTPYPDLNSEYKLYEIKPDKQPIGFGDTVKPFTNHSVQLQKGDYIYLFTDGYADQFGGPTGKKFKYKQLANIVLNGAPLTAAEQKENINLAFENWKQDLDQVDDVCIIGVGV